LKKGIESLIAWKSEQGERMLRFNIKEMSFLYQLNTVILMLLLSLLVPMLLFNPLKADVIIVHEPNYCKEIPIFYRLNTVILMLSFQLICLILFQTILL